MPSVLLQATARPALDPWQLVLDATPVVKLVILVLILMAVACWYVIGAKLVRLHKLDDQSRRFLQVFWKDEHTRQWDMDVMGSLNGQLSRFASSPIATAVGRDVKGKASVAIYLACIPLALVNRWIAVAGYVAVAGLWLVPDRRLRPT